jgi:hypothetical protein
MNAGLSFPEHRIKTRERLLRRLASKAFP